MGEICFDNVNISILSDRPNTDLKQCPRRAMEKILGKVFTEHCSQQIENDLHLILFSVMIDITPAISVLYQTLRRKHIQSWSQKPQNKAI